MSLSTSQRMMVAAAALTVHTLWGAPAAAQEGSAEAGQALAARVCASCHLVREGQPQAAMDSAPSFDALARDPAMTETRLRGFLNRPHPPMPDPQLSRAEIDAIVSHILALRRRSH